ncbi:phosphatase PAP2 family protein [bacterium]|nr:phosphatase PAP2 family protein [bacterium]
MTLFKKYKTFDWAFNIYLLAVIILITIFAPGKVNNWYTFVLKDIMFILIVNIIIYSYTERSNKILKFIRYWYPIMLFSINYSDMGHMAFIIVPQLQDPIINIIEMKIFGVHPTWWIEKHLFYRPLLETLTLGYMSYYLILPLLGFILYFKRKTLFEYEHLIFTVAVTFYFCYLFFIFFPVDGPWRFHPILDHFTMPTAGYILVPLQKKIMGFAMEHSGCFPSSHVAVATVVLLNAQKFVKKIFPYYLVIVILLFFATFFMRYHYIIDAVFGMIFGIIIFNILSRLYYKWNPRNLT